MSSNIDDIIVSLYPDANILISTKCDSNEILEQLMSIGIDRENIFIAIDSIQYFDNLNIPVENIESFVDVGCYDCKSSLDFLKWCHNDSAKVYAFEPDYDSYSKCLDTIKEKRDNIKLFPYGLYNEKTQLHFSSNKEGSRICNNGDVIVNTISMDEIIGNEKITFIKMDIEGAELNALMGAENIIRTQKPKLAICIYHKPEDVRKIPSLILNYNPNYKFYISHYTLSSSDTVLYAVDRD